MSDRKAPEAANGFRVITITMLWPALPDDEAEDIAANLGDELQAAGYTDELIGVTVSSVQRSSNGE